VDALVRLLTDPHRHVRRSAVISLGQLGPGAAAADNVVGALAALMPSDCDRYNRYYAAIALRRLGTGEASEVLLDALLAARLDPVTINGNSA
jgi:HEAT repeat protein